MKKLMCFLPFYLVLLQLNAQTDDSLFIRKLSDEILVNGQAYENLRHLTKQIGPRLAGSSGMVKSEQWGLKVMKQSGADVAWLQQCMVPHWVRGGKDQVTLVSGNKSRSLDVIALGNSEGTKGKEISGDVVLINSFDELEQKKDMLKDKIVFYNYKFRPEFVNTFHAYRDAVQYRSQGPSRASKYGARAVLIRSMSHSTDNSPHTGALRYDSAYPKIPALAVGLRDADMLADILQKGKATLKVRTNGHFLPDTIGHNVIGELKGTEFPNEIITIGGHLDSWDNCEGAHDDGAGCVQTIEVMRAFKAIGYKPKRTIRFVLFANEENGLRGGNKYAEEAKAKNEKHIFAIESDAGGFVPRALGFSVSDEQFQKVMQWKELIAPYGCDIVRGGGGADIGPLNRLLQTPVGSLNPDSQRYFDIHHARSDVFEAVNKRELDLGAVNMAAIVYLIDKYGL
jgi:hypothetical protein